MARREAVALTLTSEALRRGELLALGDADSVGLATRLRDCVPLPELVKPLLGDAPEAVAGFDARAVGVSPDLEADAVRERPSVVVNVGVEASVVLRVGLSCGDWVSTEAVGKSVVEVETETVCEMQPLVVAVVEEETLGLEDAEGQVDALALALRVCLPAEGDTLAVFEDSSVVVRVSVAAVDVDTESVGEVDALAHEVPLLENDPEGDRLGDPLMEGDSVLLVETEGDGDELAEPVMPP